jgi:hypothetical protein
MHIISTQKRCPTCECSLVSCVTVDDVSTIHPVVGGSNFDPYTSTLLLIPVSQNRCDTGFENASALAIISHWSNLRYKISWSFGTWKFFKSSKKTFCFHFDPNTHGYGSLGYWSRISSVKWIKSYCLVREAVYYDHTQKVFLKLLYLWIKSK